MPTQFDSDHWDNANNAHDDDVSSLPVGARELYHRLTRDGADSRDRLVQIDQRLQERVAQLSATRIASESEPLATLSTPLHRPNTEQFMRRAPRYPTLRRWVTMLATAAVVAAFVATLAVNVGRRSGDSSSHLQAGNQPATNSIPGVLSRVQMIDAKIGWAVSWDLAGSGAYHILRTTDGGRLWKPLLQCLSTQGLGKGFNTPCSTDFHSATVATVVQPESDSQTQTSRLRIFHTSDGGQNWQSSVIGARALETPAEFVDGLHGWVFATDHFPGPDPASAYIGGQIALYRTSDGGTSWQRIASGPSTSQIAETSDDAYGIPPFAASARLQFVTPSTGWLIGTSLHSDMSNYSWLYVTHDGGSSWHQVALAFPAEALALAQPTFFTEHEGLFPLLTSDPAAQNARGTLLFSTQDGGQTWTSTAVPLDVTNAAFLDLQHAIAVDPGGKALLTTSDGWNHWTTVPLQTTFTSLSGFDFVSPALGWALANNASTVFAPGAGRFRKGDVIALLHTTDGGRTWQEIAHSVV